MLKIYQVSFNDGGWHQSRPNYQIVSDSKENAIKIALDEHPQYKTGWDAFAYEFKIDGYVIEVYDEKTYRRDKNLETLDI